MGENCGGNKRGIGGQGMEDGLGQNTAYTSENFKQ